MIITAKTLAFLDSRRGEGKNQRNGAVTPTSQKYAFSFHSIKILEDVAAIFHAKPRPTPIRKARIV